jgi:hypothetical protein
MDTSTRTHAFETIEMSPGNVHDLLTRHVTAADAAATLVVFETCDTAGWVHDLCTTLGTSTIVVNANDERWRWRRVVALARKILIICWGMLKTNTPFRSPAMPTPREMTLLGLD